MNEETQGNQQSKFEKFSRFFNPAAIIIAGMLVAGAVFFSTEVILLKLDRIETRLPEDLSSEIIPITFPKDSASLGKANAPVLIVEYADFQCPFCKEFHDKLLSRIKAKYISNGTVRFVYQNYAFLGEESTHAAEAALCAKEQNKFWDYHDLLFNKQTGENIGDFAPAKLKGFAGDLKLDINKFNQCFNDSRYQARVQEDIIRGQDYGVNSTPTIFINGKRFEGVVPLYKIEAEIRKYTDR